MTYDLNIVKIKLANAKQDLMFHRNARESPIPANDPIVHLHDAINALQISLESLVAQIEKDQSA